MNTEKESKKKVTYPVFEMKDHGRLILPENVINQIMYLHAEVGSTEWSGILLYDVVSGNPSKPADFVLKANHIFLMDIGSAGYTSYETDGDIVDMYDKIEGAMDMKIGHVHSHHTMSAFFSGTDTDELMTNVDKHNYYLSLIVNFAGIYSCKVVFLSEVKNTRYMHYVNDSGELKKFIQKDDETHMVTIDMDIIMGYTSDFFYNRINQVREKIKAAEQTKKERESKVKTYYPNKDATQGKIFGSSYDPTEDFKEFSSSMYTYKANLNPRKLEDSDIERLTRNLVGVNANLTETRSVYQILNTIANGKEDQLDYYFDYFADNIENIITSFFDDQVLADDELEIVIKEVTLSIQRFRDTKKVKKIVSGLTEILEEFLHSATEDITLEAKDADTNEMILEDELKKLVHDKN
jgi:hypothetical protein